MLTPDLNQLLDLEVLLQEGSVAAAARRLHLSAPAMSRRLAHLRETFADPLFVLAGRRLVPTARALALRERIQRVLEDARQIIAPPVVDFARIERTLTLHANDGVIGVWAAQLVAAIRAEAPGIRIRFKPRAEKSMESLRNGEVDLDIGVLDAPAPEIYSQLLISAPFVGVVRKTHPLAKKRRIDASQFVEYPHISTSRRGHLHGPIDKALRALGLQRQIVAIVPGFQSALAMVTQSDFIAPIPEPLARWSVERDSLHLFPMPVVTPLVEISMSWHPRYHADPVHVWLREKVRKTTAALWNPKRA